MKGISLPVGDITFDLNFHSEAKSNNESFDGSDSEYTAILWDYNENVPSDKSYRYNYVDPERETLVTPSDGKGNGGRRLYWDGEAVSYTHLDVYKRQALSGTRRKDLLPGGSSEHIGRFQKYSGRIYR